MAKRPQNTAHDQRRELALERVRELLVDLQFGSITIVVQDGVVVQIDKTAKERIDYSCLDTVSGGEGI